MDFFDKDYDKKKEQSTNELDERWQAEMEQILASHIPMEKKKRKIGLGRVLVIVVVLLFGLVIISTQLFGKGWIGNRFSGDGRVSLTIPIVQKPDVDPVYLDEQGRYTTQGLAKEVTPSIVSILTYETGNVFAPSGQGSGIIMTEDGYIITNAHVIEGATFGIKVVLHDESEYEAKVIGTDPMTDIAVIKISTNGLSPAEFGDSNDVEIGEEVVAIGNPAGYSGTVTKGIVSGLNRMISTDYSNKPMSCIQIDAAINPGNSGGALLNMYGQVIGITSSKIAAIDFDGIGFAISFDAAKPIVESLLKDGYVKGQFRVGITFYGVTEKSAEMADAVAGLYVVEIAEDSDIFNSGLKVNDIITEVEGQPVTSVEELMEVLEGKEPGDEVKATVYRMKVAERGEYFDIKFKLMEYKSSITQKE